jgi:DNA-binding transcriptional LysR family regulator
MPFAKKGRDMRGMDYFAALRACARAVELGSFSKAAVDTGAKVSTVSRYVSSLEADLGVALLNRSTHRLNLTEAGTIFFERAVRILADLDEARASTTALNSSPRGLLRINTPAAFGRRHIVPHLGDFLGVYPDIRVDATLTDATVDLIDSGADVAIRIGALTDSTLMATRLAPHHRALVASPIYIGRHRILDEPRTLESHECLAFSLQPSEAWYYRPIAEPEAEPVAAYVNGRLRANDSEALLDAAVAGLGVALLPTWLVGPDIRANRLVALLQSWEWLIAPGPARSIWAVYPPKKVVSPKVRAFISFFEQRFGKPPYWDVNCRGFAPSPAV